MRLPVIACLWIGEKLTYIDQLCIKSFLAHGHRYVLYTYCPVEGLPDGAEIADASEILPLKRALHAYSYNEIDVLADQFKYRLLLKHDVIWADMDMLCLRPWDIKEDYFFAWQRYGRWIGAAALKLPKDSEVLSELHHIIETETPKPDFMKPAKLAEVLKNTKGNPKHIDFPRGTFGIHALTHCLTRHGLHLRAKPEAALFALRSSDRDLLYESDGRVDLLLSAGMYGLHLWARRVRRNNVMGEIRLPAPNAYLRKILEDYKIALPDADDMYGEDGKVVRTSTSVENLSNLDLKRAYIASQTKGEKHFSTIKAPKRLPKLDKVLVVSAMKNEGPFILEWIAYHQSIGVEKFLIYTNDCNDGTDVILSRLEDLGIVKHLSNPFKKDKGQKPQRGALNDAVTREAYRRANWVMAIDVDEFVNIHVGDGTIKGLLHETNYPNAISMTWRFFGNGGVHQYQDRFVSEQFYKCSPAFIPKPRLAWGFKTLFSTKAPYKKLGVHRPLGLEEERKDDVRWVNGSGRQMPEMILDNSGWRSTKRSVGYDMVTLNHYVLRSAESYLIKRERGRINHVDQDQGLSYWVNRDFDGDEDLSIARHIPRAKDHYAKLLQDPKLAWLHQKAIEWHREKIDKLKQDADYKLLYDKITGAVAYDKSEITPEEIHMPQKPREGRTDINVTILTIMKDEAPFILEWIAWYRGLGISHFIIFTNDCSDGTDLMLDRLAEMGIVTHLPNPSMLMEDTPPHYAALRYAPNLAVYRKADWIFHCDVDEFLALRPNGRNLPELLQSTPNLSAISFSECLMGSSGVASFEDDLVTAQFTRGMPQNPAADEARRGVKTVFRNVDIWRGRRNHRPVPRKEHRDGLVWLDGAGKQMPQEFIESKEPGIDCVGRHDWGVLYHYSTRSIDGFIAKLERGDAVKANRTRGLKYWRKRNQNGEEHREMAEQSEALRKAVDKLKEDKILRELHDAAVAYHKGQISDRLDNPDIAGFRARVVQVDGGQNSIEA